MSKKIIVICFGVLLAACSTSKDDVYKPGSSKTDEPEPAVVPVREPDYSGLTAANHPRLIMDDEELASLKTRLAEGSDEILVTLHNKAITIANTYIGGSEIVYKLDASGRRILSQAKDCTSRLLHLSYAWRTTGEQKYLDEAERVLGWVLAFPDWNAKKHFLDPAEMAGGVAICYDWLYPVLNSATKAKIEQAFKDWLFYPAKNKIWNNNFYEAFDNWNTSCNGGIISAALAIYENDATECKAMIEKGVASIPKSMKYSFSPDGAYEEGYSYLSDVLSKIPILIITPLKDCLGTDSGISATEGWRKASDCFLFMEGATDTQFNYSDADRYIRPCYGQWYFAYDFNDPSVLFNELRLIRKNAYTPSGENGRFFPMVLAYASKMGSIDFSKVTPPSRTMFSGKGDEAGEGVDLCMFHTKWDKSSDDRYLGVKGGKAASSHAHMDAGEFVYDAFGVRWSMDLGLQAYTSLESYLTNQGGSLWDMSQNSLRWTVVRLNNRYHSTLTINDEDHLVNGYATLLSAYEHSDGTRGCSFDLTPVFGSNVAGCVRTVEMKGDDLLIIDEITAPKTSQTKVSWRMVTAATPTVNKNYITLKSGTRTMYLKSSSSGPTIEYATWEPAPKTSYDAANNGITIVGFNGTVTTNKTVTFTTVLTPVEP